MKKLGFTLVEILIATALMGIISVVGGDILITVFRSYAKSKVLSEVERNGNYATSFLENELKQASSVSIITCPSGVGNSCVSYINPLGENVIIEFIVPNCPLANGYLRISKSGTISDLTNRDIKLGVNVESTGSGSIFSVLQQGGVTRVAFSFKISEACSQSVGGSGEFNSLVKIRGY